MPILTERDITDGIAGIAARDEAFRVGLLRALLRQAGRGNGQPAAYARELLRCVPRRHLELLNQHYVGHVPTMREVLREFAGGRQTPDWSHIDWVFRGREIVVAVEVKTNKRTPFQPGQLEKYHRALTLDPALDRRDRGLLALTRLRPFRDDLVRARRRPFDLGFVLWDDVAAELHSFAPGDTTARLAWSRILGAVNDRQGTVDHSS
jgi:hypothetical protein